MLSQQSNIPPGNHLFGEYGPISASCHPRLQALKIQKRFDRTTKTVASKIRVSTTEEEMLCSSWRSEQRLHEIVNTASGGMSEAGPFGSDEG